MRKTQIDRPILAALLMVLAQLSFSGNILLIRISERFEAELCACTYKMTPWEPMLLRSFAMSLLCGVQLYRRPQFTLIGRDKFWLWARGFAGVLSLSAYYYGILHIPLGVASVFSNSSALYLTMLAWLFLGEKLSKMGLLGLCFGFIGVALVGLGAGLTGQGELNGFDIGISMLSGPLGAAAYFSIRKLRNVKSEQIMFSLGVAGILVSALMLIVGGTNFPSTTTSWLWLLLSIAPALLAQQTLTWSLSLAPASQLAPLQYSAPLFSGLLGFVFLSETIPNLSLLGIGLVIIFGLILPLWLMRRPASIQGPL